MEYMYGLPFTKYGNDSVFVVMEFFYKMDILVACKNSIIADDTAKLFFEQVSVHFGILQNIILD